MDLDLGAEERLEEAEPLDVVHVQMGQQQIDTRDPIDDRAPEAADSRSRVEHQHAAVGGLAPRRTRCCRRSASSRVRVSRASRACPRA